MRIIAGELGGRRLVAPRGWSTRPTKDRVRESLFSSLVSLSGRDIFDAVVLDAFAGSGALGLEAVSRGATHVTFVERDPQALRALRVNIATLGMQDRCHVLAGDVFSLAERLRSDPFSLILLDPPYTLDAARTAALLEALASRSLIFNDALVSWEHAVGAGVVWPSRFVPVTSKTYGSTAIDIAKYEAESGGT